MSLLTCVLVGDGRYDVKCPHCGVSVGIFDIDEVTGMSRVGVVPVCFDCDSLNVDKVPEHLRLAEEVYAMIIDDQPFFCQWDDAGFHVSLPITHLQWATLVQPRLWSGSPLSSSTYLHAPKPKDGAGGDE